MRKTFCLLAVSLHAFFSSSQAIDGPFQWSNGVKTNSGIIFGHSARNVSNVDEFLGIPYAKAPEGKLRFAPPEKYESTAKYVASHYAILSSKDLPAEFDVISECPAGHGHNGTLPGQLYTETESRIIGNFLEQFNVTQSEDCLAVNVWSKRTGDQKKPVLLWAYGGRFESGWSSSPFYRGQYLAAKEDIVVVTFNYRFGIFGFPGGAPDKNVGILDARAALEWVRDNIAGFGGDPSRITFAGHSAGGFVADMLAFAWPSDPIAAGYILQSGVATTVPANPQNVTEASFKNVAKALGCEDGEHALDCVRQKDWEDVLAASLQVPAPSTLTVPFYPTVDDEVVFDVATYDAKGASGNFAQVPTLLGNADYEAGFYKIQLSASDQYFNETFWYILSQALATCPAAASSQQRVTNGVPTWRYRYFGEFHTLQLYSADNNGSSKGSGAYHGSELTPLWGTSQDVTLVKDTKDLEDMSSYIMRAWAAFVHDPKQGLKGFGWPRYTLHGKTLVSLGKDGHNGATFGNSTAYDDNCEEILAKFWEQ